MYVSTTTSITAIGCWQCLPLSIVQLKGKHCRKPHCRNGVVDTFGQGKETATKPHMSVSTNLNKTGYKYYKVRFVKKKAG